jgi:hypothetical protein
MEWKQKAFARRNPFKSYGRHFIAWQSPAVIHGALILHDPKWPPLISHRTALVICDTGALMLPG